MTAEQFRAALKALHVRQIWMAQQLGVSPHTVNRWATGRGEVPQYAVFALGLLAEVRKPEMQANQVAAFADHLKTFIRDEVEAFKVAE